MLAQVDAGLGQKDLAIREAQHAIELMPISKDIYDGALVLEGCPGLRVERRTRSRD